MNQTMAISANAAPRVARSSLENARWDVRGNLLSILLGGEETAGRFALMEITEWPGAAPPRHIHHREDEVIYVVDGALTVEIAGRAYTASPGMVAFIPRGTEHGFAVETARAKLLVFILPAGLEGSFLDTSRPAPVLAMPPRPPTGSFSHDLLLELTAKYATEVTGPPVERRSAEPGRNGRP